MLDQLEWLAVEPFIKNVEIARFGTEVTVWEQAEYFDIF